MSATAAAGDSQDLSITDELLWSAGSFRVAALRRTRMATVAARRALTPASACDVDTTATTVHIMDTHRSVPGAQAIARAAALLRLVSAGGAAGLTVSELARRADLTRPTTHRLLTALRHEGLVDQDEARGTWMPGPELYLMGAAAASR